MVLTIAAVVVLGPTTMCEQLLTDSYSFFPSPPAGVLGISSTAGRKNVLKKIVLLYRPLSNGFLHNSLSHIDINEEKQLLQQQQQGAILLSDHRKLMGKSVLTLEPHLCFPAFISGKNTSNNQAARRTGSTADTSNATTTSTSHTSNACRCRVFTLYRPATIVCHPTTCLFQVCHGRENFTGDSMAAGRFNQVGKKVRRMHVMLESRRNVEPGHHFLLAFDRTIFRSNRNLDFDRIRTCALREKIAKRPVTVRYD